MSKALTIYQMKQEEPYKFMPYDFVCGKQGGVTSEQYNEVYTGPMGDDESLEDIFNRFNTAHPADYKGHSLSVSDVVVIHEGGKDAAYYVDSIGFKKLTGFKSPECFF